jgi:hypothetical protein
MLFYCEYTWHPGTNMEMVRARHDRQHKSGELRLDLCRGWYNFAGSGQGFLLVEADDAAKLHNFIFPYADLMVFTARPLTETNIEEAQARIAERVRQAG